MEQNCVGLARGVWFCERQELASNPELNFGTAMLAEVSIVFCLIVGSFIISCSALWGILDGVANVATMLDSTQPA